MPITCSAMVVPVVFCVTFSPFSAMVVSSGILRHLFHHSQQWLFQWYSASPFHHSQQWLFQWYSASPFHHSQQWFVPVVFCVTVSPFSAMGLFQWYSASPFHHSQQWLFQWYSASTFSPFSAMVVPVVFCVTFSPFSMVPFSQVLAGWFLQHFSPIPH